MPYYTGTIVAVPTASKQDYIDHAAATWQVFRKYGAERMVETWGVDVPHGKLTDLHRAVEAKDDETVVFSWIAWPDRASADTAWKKMEQDSAMAALPRMPFDGSRMIYGGFAPVYSEGEPVSGGYYQGFALAVPEKNRQPYVAMADEGWQMFRKHGALAMVEGWGEDVPRGKRTDFYRAAQAVEGEVPVFSWIAWPDRDTCDTANKAMESEMESTGMPEMPFDGKRMMWGGFEPVFDSRASS